MSEMGMFNHVPKPDEVAAKAFSMSRDEQEQWSWPSYCCGLSDGGVCDARVTEIMFAAMNGEFSHNTEQAFSGELSPMHDHIEQMEIENDRLRELAQEMYSYAANREIELCNACTEADDGDCNACDAYGGACGIAKRRFEELFSDRMSELGIKAVEA